MVQWFFLDFRERLFEQYSSIFSGGQSTDKQQRFSKKWGWYSILMVLANDDVLKIDQATEIGIGKCFTYLAYIKDKENAKK